MFNAFTHPQIVGKHECKDSDALIVVAAGHWTTDVAGHHSDETGGKQTRPGGPHFFGEEISGYRCQATEGKNKHLTLLSRTSLQY